MNRRDAIMAILDGRVVYNKLWPKGSTLSFSETFGRLRFDLSGTEYSYHVDCNLIPDDGYDLIEEKILVTENIVNQWYDRITKVPYVSRADLFKTLKEVSIGVK